MNNETAKKCFDALTAGEERDWDCRVLTKDGVFKAKLAEFPQLEKSLKHVQIANKLDNQHVWDLDLAKYSHKAVLEFLRFVYLSETGNLRTQNDQRYLAEDVWALAVEFEIAELQFDCVKALSSDSIAVDEENFLRLAQLGGGMNSKPLVRKCLKIFQQKLAVGTKDALREVREGAPMFLNAVIVETIRYHPPASIARSNPKITVEGFAIAPHDFDNELFEEVLSSDHFDETKWHLSNFGIRCSDAPDRPIRCHSIILARVPHFRQMIQHDCEETRRKFIEVNKERKVVIETLRYVYTGNNTDLLHTVKDQETLLAESVIDLAQQYGLYVLKHRCHEAMLECDISHSNVLRLIGVAVLYELNELKSKCLRYFFDNREVLITMDQWLNADVAVVRTVVECVLILPTHIERFCVCDDKSVWTVDGNGCESSKTAISKNDTCVVWTTPLVQLDYRTVMILMNDRQTKLFDVIDHSVADCSQMQFDHFHGSACLFDGVVYVTGGGGNDADSDSDTDIDCDDANDSDSDADSDSDDSYVDSGRRRPSVIADDDTYENDDARCKCERYNRATNTWERVADLSRSRWGHALVVWKGSLLAIGGLESDGSIERYDAVADRWEVIRESEGRLDDLVRAADINSELWLYVCDNGEEEEDYEWEWKAWKVDLDADEWVEIPALDGQHGYGVYVLEQNRRAYLIGLNSRSRSTCLLAFDKDSNGWKEVFEISKSEVAAIPIVSGEL